MEKRYTYLTSNNNYKLEINNLGIKSIYNIFTSRRLFFILKPFKVIKPNSIIIYNPLNNFITDIVNDITEFNIKYNHLENNKDKYSELTNNCNYTFNQVSNNYNILLSFILNNNKHISWKYKKIGDIDTFSVGILINDTLFISEIDIDYWNLFRLVEVDKIPDNYKITNDISILNSL